MAQIVSRRHSKASKRYRRGRKPSSRIPKFSTSRVAIKLKLLKLSIKNVRESSDVHLCRT
ncbi:MAG: hypothetical protein RJB01_219 [Actinomycetota bacterium]